MWIVVSLSCNATAVNTEHVNLSNALSLCFEFSHTSCSIVILLLLRRDLVYYALFVRTEWKTAAVVPYVCTFVFLKLLNSRSQWSRGLRRESAAARLLGLWVRILPVAWMSACCECCVLLGRGPCVGLVTRPEKSYRPEESYRVQYDVPRAG